MYLVTGGAGFFGMHMCKVLLEEGHDVLAIGTSSFTRSEANYFAKEESERLRFVTCDISDVDAVRSVVASNPVSVIIHAAVITVLGEDEFGHERRMTEVNAMGTLNLLEAARSSRIERFVFISSSGLYGSHGQGVAPVHESTTVYPGGTSVYRTCKVYSEMMCQNFHSHGAFPVVIARIGSPYGPWEQPTKSRLGTSPIYTLLELGLKKVPARVYGRNMLRDWTHMRDIAWGVNLLSTCDVTQLRHRIYNVTNGTTSSIEHVLQALSHLIPGFDHCFVDSREDANVDVLLENTRGPLDISRLREDVGFVPKLYIDDGLADYVEWAETCGWQ